MARAKSHDVALRKAGIQGGIQTASGDARRNRMLRELGFSTSERDAHNRAPDLSPLRPEPPSPAGRRDAYEDLEAQLKLERWLRAEAVKRAEMIQKALDDAEAKSRVEIEFRVQVERNARAEAEANLRAERQAREEVERRLQQLMDSAGSAHAETITQAISEMMARVQAEQQAITEQRVRAAAEDCGEDDTVEIVSRKRGVLYKVLFPSRNRLPH